MKRLLARARESLFTLPLTIVLACVVAAVAALYVDSSFAESIEDWPIILGSTVPGGRAIATTVAGATITVAAIVFSITALSTQMASNQYSPRALGGFFEDRAQQIVIGLVVGTFTYSLLVLAALSTAIIDSADATPSVSVTLDIVLGVGSAIAIVAYINHSLRRMQIDDVVRRIASASVRSIEKHLAEQEGDPVPEGALTAGEPTQVTAARSGWVVAIETRLVLASLPSEGVARIDVRLGEAVAPGDRLMTVWVSEPESWKQERRMRRAVVTAPERSIELDPTFGIRQLVDIALRALSPGVNDPTTAVDVIHHLKTPVRTVLFSEAPHRIVAGEGGRRVFLPQTPSRSDYVHFAFSEIRLAAKSQPYVLRALIEVLDDLSAELDRDGFEGRRAAVRQELDLTMAALEQSDVPAPDRDRILAGRRRDHPTPPG